MKLYNNIDSNNKFTEFLKIVFNLLTTLKKKIFICHTMIKYIKLNYIINGAQLSVST